MLGRGAWVGVSLKIGQCVLGIIAGILLFRWLMPRWWSYPFAAFAAVEGIGLISVIISVLTHLKDKDEPPRDDDYDKY